MNYGSDLPTKGALKFWYADSCMCKNAIKKVQNIEFIKW